MGSKFNPNDPKWIRETRDIAPPEALLRSRRCAYGCCSLPPCDVLFGSLYFLGDRIEFKDIRRFAVSHELQFPHKKTLSVNF